MMRDQSGFSQKGFDPSVFNISPLKKRLTVIDDRTAHWSEVVVFSFACLLDTFVYSQNTFQGAKTIAIKIRGISSLSDVG